MTDLKPCPFCGGEARIYKQMRSDPPCHYMVYLAICDMCGCRTKDYTCDGYYGETFEQKDVIESWNRREA